MTNDVNYPDNDIGEVLRVVRDLLSLFIQRPDLSAAEKTTMREAGELLTDYDIPLPRPVGSAGNPWDEIMHGGGG